MSNVNIFEQASKDKVRFATGKGELTVEQLWDLPLTHERQGFLTLDLIAREVNAQLKEVSTESFVPTKPNPLAAGLALKLDILKYIIADKVAAEAARKEAAETKAKRDRLMNLLVRKEEAAAENLTVEEIRKQLDALG